MRTSGSKGHSNHSVASVALIRKFASKYAENSGELPNHDTSECHRADIEWQHHRHGPHDEEQTAGGADGTARRVSIRELVFPGGYYDRRLNGDHANDQRKRGRPAGGV